MESAVTRQSSSSQQICPPIVRGIALLRQAREYAVDLRRDLWDFAVEIATLRDVAMTNSDLRWLVCKGYVEHSVEITLAGRGGREFQQAGDLTFSDRTCFVLTDAGAEFAANVHRAETRLGSLPPHESNGGTTFGRIFDSEDSTAHDANGKSNVPADKSRDASLVPTWDRSRHELRFEGQLVKIFKLPSANQEAILMAFEEEGWPPQIDDPLPPLGDLDPKRRLHDAIKGLNRNQKSRLLRFMGDGTGQGIRWEPRVAPDASPDGKAE